MDSPIKPPTKREIKRAKKVISRLSRKERGAFICNALVGSLSIINWGRVVFLGRHPIQVSLPYFWATVGEEKKDGMSLLRRECGVWWWSSDSAPRIAALKKCYNIE